MQLNLGTANFAKPCSRASRARELAAVVVVSGRNPTSICFLSMFDFFSKKCSMQSIVHPTGCNSFEFL